MATLDVRDPLHILDNEKLKAQADRFAALGLRWVIFYGSVWEGSLTKEAMYLGDEPVEATFVGLV